MSKLLPLIIVILFFSSCANYKLNYAKAGKDWNTVQLPKDKKLSHSIYLLGDAGNSPEGGKSIVLKALEKRLNNETENSSIIFLGDNLYPSGMTSKGSDTRALEEHRLTSQMDILNNYKGTPYFIPGNHDWWKEGKKGLRRQEKFIEKYLNEKRGITDDEDENWGNYFLPDDGCSGPSIVEVNDRLVIIFIDSQWWMKDWDNEPNIHDGCSAVTRQKFKFLFENAVRKHRTKNVVVAMHHPNESYGSHGGRFTFKDHLKPVPIFGSLIIALRSVIGHNTDLIHKNYRAFNNAIGFSVGKNGSYILAAGHEHNIQYIAKNNQHYIVSGSGSKESGASLGKGSEFAYGGSGYSKLYFYEDGTTYTEFYKVNEDLSDEIVFRKKLKGKLENIEENIPETYPEFDKGSAKESSLVTTMDIKPIGSIKKLILGEHFRDIYNINFDFPTLNMDTLFGGLTPLKQGGGNQTNSLRVRSDETGRDYVLRGMTKDATRFIPPPFNKMDGTQAIVEQTFLSTHPFAPLAFPILSDAIDVYHTNPKLYYIQSQPRLKYFNSVFANSVHLIEERPGGKKWKDSNVFGGADKIIGTPDLVEKMEKNRKHIVDQKSVLRARLLDIMVGDWDRHDDQWRWAAFDQEDGTILYRPIPRDRDQAFSKYDGLIVTLARLTIPFLKSLRVYEPEIKKFKWLVWSGRHFDHSFINKLNWEEWQEEVKFIQENLTDDVIEKAIGTFPEEVKGMTAEHIISSIKARRDNLMNYAEKYFKIHSKLVEVLGTNDRDLFEIERLPDNKTKVSVYDFRKGEKGERYYERIIDNTITEEIDIYGRQDDDKFVVIGNVKKGAKVRLIGGLGKDHFIDESSVAGFTKKTKVYDNFKKNTLELGTESADKRDKRREYNLYDRQSLAHEFDLTFPLYWGGFNPDEGLYVGGFFIYTDYGFKKSPYRSSHRYGARVASRTGSVDLIYKCDFIDVLNKWDIYGEMLGRTPTFSRNFFGLGNGSLSEEGRDREFYRVKEDRLSLTIALKNTFLGNSGYYAIGPTFETTQVESTDGRFINSTDTNLPDFTFDRKYFGGITGRFEFDNTDNFFIPINGMRLSAKGNLLRNFNDENSYTFATLSADLRIYKPLDKNEKIIFATRIGGGRAIGDRTEFFNLPNLGGNSSLRGYSDTRFYGNSSFYQNIDLRIKLFESVNHILPYTLGIYGGFDYGRIWQKEEISDHWHYNYGGGIWFAPVNTLNISAGLFIPRETETGIFEQRFVVNLGFGF